MSLITAAQVREHFTALTGTGQDSLLDTMIDRADALMAGWCGWPPSAGVYTMASASYTLYPAPHTTYPEALWHGLKWVTAVTTAHIDEDWDYGADDLVDAGDLVIDNDLGALWLRPDSSWAWSASPRSNKVVLVNGFATTPDDLVAACAMQTRALLDLARVQGVSQVSAGGQSFTRSDTDAILLRSVKEALQPYINWRSRAG